MSDIPILIIGKATVGKAARLNNLFAVAPESCCGEPTECDKQTATSEAWPYLT